MDPRSKDVADEFITRAPASPPIRPDKFIAIGPGYPASRFRFYAASASTRPRALVGETEGPRV